MIWKNRYATIAFTAPEVFMDNRSEDDVEVSKLVEMTGCAGTTLDKVDTTLQEIEEKKYDSQIQELKDFFALEWDKHCYFSDGKRQIDYVLAYEDDFQIDVINDSASLTDCDQDEDDEEGQQSPASAAEKRRIRRFNFETNLQKMGLQIERANISPMLGRTRFVLLHAPFSVLEKQAQILSVKLPVQQSDVDFQDIRQHCELLRGKELSQRELLYNHWASWRNIFKYQPLNCIKRYFGTKVAFYFAWLGYYTRTLYLAAIVGVISVIYGFSNISEDVVSNDICGDDGVGTKILICPQCENYCDFQFLGNSCVYAKMSYLFDNGSTVVFAALMSVWATLFLEGWKRYHAEIAWKWGLLDIVVEEETVRPEFQFRVKTKRYNPVTQQEEPYLSGKKKLANFTAAAATVLFFICLVLAVVFGMVVYRVICMRLLASMDNPAIDSFAFLIVSMTAAAINLVVIITMNYFYNSLAHRLTRWECPRTQADFDNSYTAKVFLFQFANYYSSLFYIAFFKGILSQIPGTKDNDGNVKIAGYRLEGCDPAGCFVELVVQLATIMCGKQFFSAFIEFAYPNFMSLMRKWQLMVPLVETKKQRKNRIRKEHSKKMKNLTRWEADYYLYPTYDQFLFDEYLEMVLQFGFVTLFVSAFPLAPLFAVINNIFEIRLDAYKFLITTQKPVPAQAKNIGVWLSILDVISKFSVIINALVIAFTSDFVPKTMYYLTKQTMIGYVDSSLSYFDASAFKLKTSQFRNVSQCRYRGWRRSPCTLMSETTTIYGKESCDDQLGPSSEWWKVFAARLLFVLIFEHIVFIIKMIVEYLIPDVPTKIFIQQQREKYLVRKALLSELAIGRRSANGPCSECNTIRLKNLGMILFLHSLQLFKDKEVFKR
uniref:Anoctamin n=1 Tax=Angiostrongylus cantonensis TaxID=6313 RepID=A0A0K0DDD1_ANGCA